MYGESLQDVMELTFLMATVNRVIRKTDVKWTVFSLREEITSKSNKETEATIGIMDGFKIPTMFPTSHDFWSRISRMDNFRTH